MEDQSSGRNSGRLIKKNNDARRRRTLSRSTNFSSIYKNGNLHRSVGENDYIATEYPQTTIRDAIRRRSHSSSYLQNISELQSSASSSAYTHAALYTSMVHKLHYKYKQSEYLIRYHPKSKDRSSGSRLLLDDDSAPGSKVFRDESRTQIISSRYKRLFTRISELWTKNDFNWQRCSEIIVSYYFDGVLFENLFFLLFVSIKLCSDIIEKQYTNLLTNVFNIFLNSKSPYFLNFGALESEEWYEYYSKKLTDNEDCEFEINEAIIERSFKLIEKGITQAIDTFQKDLDGNKIYDRYSEFRIDVNKLKEVELLDRYFRKNDMDRFLISILSTLSMMGTKIYVEELASSSSVVVPNFYSNYAAENYFNILKTILPLHMPIAYYKPNYWLTCNTCRLPLYGIGISGIYCAICKKKMHIACAMKDDCCEEINSSQKISRGPINSDPREISVCLLTHLKPYSDLLNMNREFRHSRDAFTEFKHFHVEKKLQSFFHMINEIIYMHKKYAKALVVIFHSYIFSLQYIDTSPKFLKQIQMSKNLWEFQINTNKIAFISSIYHDKILLGDLLELYHLKAKPNKKWGKFLGNIGKVDDGNELNELLGSFCKISRRYYDLRSRCCRENVSMFARALVFLKDFFANFNLDKESAEKIHFDRIRAIPLCSEKSFKSIIADLDNRYPQLDILYKNLESKAKLLSKNLRDSIRFDEVIQRQRKVKNFFQTEYSRWAENYRFMSFMKEVTYCDAINSIVPFYEVMSEVLEEIYFFRKVVIENVISRQRGYLAISPKYLIYFTTVINNKEISVQNIEIKTNEESIMRIPPVLDITGIKLVRNQTSDGKCFLIGVKNCFPFNLLCILEDSESIELLDNVLKEFYESGKEDRHNIYDDKCGLKTFLKSFDIKCESEGKKVLFDILSRTDKAELKLLTEVIAEIIKEEKVNDAKYIYIDYYIRYYVNFLQITL